MHFPVGERGLVLGFVLPSFHVVIYGAFFGFLKFLVTYPMSMLYPTKKIFFVLYRALIQNSNNALNCVDSNHVHSF